MYFYFDTIRKKNWCSTCDIYYQNYFVNTYNGQNAISLLHPESNRMMNLWQGLTEELSKDGACERAIFPDTSVVVTRCTMIGNLNVEGVSKLFIFTTSLVSLSL